MCHLYTAVVKCVCGARLFFVAVSFICIRLCYLPHLHFTAWTMLLWFVSFSFRWTKQLSHLVSRFEKQGNIALEKNKYWIVLWWIKSRTKCYDSWHVTVAHFPHTDFSHAALGLRPLILMSHLRINSQTKFKSKIWKQAQKHVMLGWSALSV